MNTTLSDILHKLISTAAGNGGITMDDFIVMCVFIMIGIQIVVTLAISCMIHTVIYIYRKCNVMHTYDEINLNPEEYVRARI